jgi:gliding motility-associated lipoprotein GldD
MEATKVTTTTIWLADSHAFRALFTLFVPMRLLSGLILGILLLSSCIDDESSAIPRPRGYFRLDLPQKSYVGFESDCPFTFEIPNYSRVKPITSKPGERCWMNLEFPIQHATLHLSYKDISGNFASLSEDSRTMAYKHAVRANGIQETLYQNPESHVYGTMYKISGNAASSVQFYLTDSVSHYMHGSLYFFSSPNADSLQPVNEFLTQDIEHLIQTLRWK